MPEQFPGWQADALGGLTLSVTIGGQEIRLATVTWDAEHGLYETYIGLPMGADQLGRDRREPGARRGQGRGLPGRQAAKTALTFRGAAYPHRFSTEFGGDESLAERQDACGAAE